MIVSPCSAPSFPRSARYGASSVVPVLLLFPVSSPFPRRKCDFFFQGLVPLVRTLFNTIGILSENDIRRLQMDRTSILGDTIDYMRELLDRIQILREEMEQGNGACAPSRESPATELLGILKDRLSHDEALIRNTPKVRNIRMSYSAF